MNVIFVKWGNKYSSEDVNNLADPRILGFDSIYCYTDNPEGLDPHINPIIIEDNLVGVWNKLKLFDRDFPLTGITWFFDLDIVFRELPNLSPLHFSTTFDTLRLVHDNYKPKSMINPFDYDVTINSSIMAWDSDNEDIHKIWDHFKTLPDYFTRKYQGIDRFLYHEGFSNIISFFHKSFCFSWDNQEDNDASIILFNGVDFGSENIQKIAQDYSRDIR